VALTGSFYIRMHGQLGSDKSPPRTRCGCTNVAPPTAPTNLLGTANGSTVNLAWKNTFGAGGDGLVLDDRLAGDVAAADAG
jgi:hypothetical protein